MDGLYLSSEKKQKQKPETPLDPNEFQQLTQIGDELVDSFYKLSDTLGNSQQGLLQGAQVTTTGGSHKRHQSGSSILNSAMKASSQRYGERKQETDLSLVIFREDRPGSVTSHTVDSSIQQI